MIPKGKIHTFIFTQKPPWLSHSKPLKAHRAFVTHKWRSFEAILEAVEAPEAPEAINKERRA